MDFIQHLLDAVRNSTGNLSWCSLCRSWDSSGALPKYKSRTFSLHLPAWY